MNEISRIISRYTDYFFKYSVKASADSFNILAAENGLFFDDIDYNDKTLSAWKASVHLSRLCAITADIGEEALETDAEKRKTVIGLFDYWLNNDIQNPNWWHNQIGVPRFVAQLCFMLMPYLTDDQFAKANTILLRGSLKGNEAINRWTGANLMWGVFGTINHALLNSDDELLRIAVDRGVKEVEIKDGLSEGIKPDMSFYQHGPMIYTYGYGRSFTNDTAILMYIFSGTSYMPSAEKVKLFEDFVLDGSQYFSHNGYADYMTIGREFCRKGDISLSGAFTQAVELMCKTEEFSRKDELIAFYNSLCGKGYTNGRGVKLFPDSYMMTSHSGKSYMSAKGVHTDYLCSEAGNFEHYLAFNFFDGGTVCFMNDGDEYFDISPVWDFSFIPGTTAFVENDKILLDRTGNYERWYSKKGETDCCSLAQKDNTAVMGMKIKRAGITGYCTRIATPGMMILIGSDITVHESDIDAQKTVVTTLDQTYLKDNCTLEQEAKELKKSESVTNGGFTYTNLCNSKMIAQKSTVTGNWKRNNRDYNHLEDVTSDIFKVYFEHNSTPQKAKYAAAVTEDGITADIKKMTIDNTVHSIVFNNGQSITVSFSDEKCKIEIE